jgi:very-short-patch-repair endonuclease
VRPGDAINCIYRGKSLILAGDDKQLPPTSFFERVDGEALPDDDDDTDISEFQSILELAKGSGGFNNLRLNWHYRSRHEDLIAYSNYKFYEGSLITYPSAHSEGADVGVEFIHSDGVYRRGGGADNPGEAADVARRVLHHFTTRPNLTLGVVTFSVSQADAIWDALEKAREDRRDLDRFFDEGDRLNAFFVKSLESVQGDERDVIIFSIGYGPDEAGKVTTNFGVLNKPKGWRRLNVAITRARQRVEVVSSVRAGEIPPSENENVEFLRNYLDYAERGRVTLALNIGASGIGPESPFEESVLRTVQNWGYELEPQVGSAGFRIDMAVRHPLHLGVFVLGIECDGYQYHSAPAARDRDRLRDEVLRGLGWRLHRIWGTAWYRNRADEEHRLRAAIEAAIAAPMDGRTQAGERPQRVDVTTSEVQFESTPSWAMEYKASEVGKLPRWLSPSDENAPQHMADVIKNLAAMEGPVHIDILLQRLKDGWNLGRITPKIRENVDAAIRLGDPGLVRDEDFIDLKGHVVDRVRRAGVVSMKVEYVHLKELGLAVTLLLRDAGVAQRTELVAAVARVFGWARTGVEINRRLTIAIDGLVTEGVIASEGAGELRLAKRE